MDRSLVEDDCFDEVAGRDIRGQRSCVKLLANLRGFMVGSHRECRSEIAGGIGRSAADFCDDECDRVSISTKI
ncbi:hypothetical protein [Mesorhizobium sp. 131-3-5]|jgi:hypothetical protein|uniref:hypothetical protein n=1 Tax=Mesorhizobium sp. 131-3-5 TaxID=2744520 RepID=UPI00192530EA|nr:hypothetical protein [Mesorhizobium sp. 131-3-5]